MPLRVPSFSFFRRLVVCCLFCSFKAPCFFCFRFLTTRSMTVSILRGFSKSLPFSRSCISPGGVRALSPRELARKLFRLHFGRGPFSDSSYYFWKRQKTTTKLARPQEFTEVWCVGCGVFFCFFFFFFFLFSFFCVLILPGDCSDPLLPSLPFRIFYSDWKQLFPLLSPLFDSYHFLFLVIAK